MLNVLPKLLIELRDDPDVDAIVDGRVRSPEPAPGDAAWSLDANKNRTYANAFVVITGLAGPRLPRAPIQTALIGVRCYGRTPKEADDLYAACSDAIHHAGPRLHGNGLGIYISHDTTGGTPSKDPDTQQPYTDFVVELIATTQAVA